MGGCIYGESPGTHHLFLFSGAFPRWVLGNSFFQVLILRIYPFPFHVKISSHRCNPPQRNLHLWILIKNPLSHFSSSEGLPGWRSSPPLIHVCKWDAPPRAPTGAGASAGLLRAVGGRTNSDKSLSSQAARQCILATAKAWGLMKWDQEDASGVLSRSPSPSLSRARIPALPEVSDPP